MSGWVVEEKPYCTGSMGSNRAKVVMTSEDGLLKVTVEVTKLLTHEQATALTKTLGKWVRGDTSLALGILNVTIRKLIKALYE